MAGIHDKLNRVRKPRVHIKYDVETEGGVVEKELPFVVGVMGDFSGDSEKPRKLLKDRKFTQIDRDNFDEVMANIEPGVHLKVENTLVEDDTDLAMKLKFSSMDDFEPANLIKQVEPLKELFEAREKLSMLLSKADRSDDLENLLEDVLKHSEPLEQMASELNLSGDKPSTEDE